MPHDDRGKSPTSAAIVSMHVASANAARLDAYQQLIFGGLRCGHVDYVKLLVLRK
jgi:hypothetical protein